MQNLKPAKIGFVKSRFRRKMDVTENKTEILYSTKKILIQNFISFAKDSYFYNYYYKW